MRNILTACDRCGLRGVRHELEQRGIVVRFCDDCYWGEVQQPGLAETGAEETLEAPAAGNAETAA